MRCLLMVCVIMLRYLVGVYSDAGYLLIACMLVLGLLCGLGLSCGVWVFVIAAGCDFGFVCVHVDVVEVVGLGVVGLGLHIWSLRCVCV